MHRTIAPVVLALVGGCGTSGGGSPGTPEAEAPKDRDEVPAAPCGDADPSGALTMFAGSVCGWTLRAATGTTVELVHFTKNPSRSAGQMPVPCETLPCRVRGVETPVGPVLVVEIGGAESEVPSGVWLGVALGEQLRFVDLWEEAGELVVEDGISLGPAHALAPFDCDGAVALFAESRLPGAARVPVPVSLQRREGAIAGGSAVAQTRCEPLTVGLP